jgi:hypothetical protein
MLAICLLSELMTREFGVGWLRGGQLAVNLVNVLRGGEALTTSGQVREEVAEGRLRRVHVDVSCTKDDGTVTVIGSASARR